MNTTTSHLIAAILGGLIVAGGFAYNALKPSLPSVLAPVSDDLAKVKQELLDCQKLRVYASKAKKKLDLPDTVKADPDKHVVAASPVPPSDYPHTMTAVYDSGTGAVDMYLRQDKLAWLAVNTRYEIGIGYGYSDNGSVTRLDGAVELLQVKALHVGVVGTVDSSGAAYVGGRAWFRW